MAEFTGERVIPGKVDADLYNEHFARYAFAARLARQKRVLDLACGSGYGAGELASVARAVTAIDVAPDAVDYAAKHFASQITCYAQASAAQLPFRDASFDLIVAFELIEHLATPDAESLLAEARRLLASGGQFIVSTPNRLYYAESRRKTGPNPFHVHEYEFDEFRDLLHRYFPHVLLFLQNHTAALAFHPCEATNAIETRSEPVSPSAAESHFFVAVCALSPQLGSPTFLYLPAGANVLREREQHILALEGELGTKNQWLENALQDHATLVAEHTAQTAELKQRNLWAEQLNRDLQAAGQRVNDLQSELAEEQRNAAQVVAQYEEKLAELESDIRAKTQWALDTEARLTAELTAKCEELARCVELLDKAEATLEERTRWALDLKKELEAIQSQLASVQASRWYRLGRTMGLGPQIAS